jgi:hypothetical protein
MVGEQGLLTGAILSIFAVPALIAGFDYFRQKGATVAESAAYGILTILMVVSWIAQLVLLIGWRAAYLPALLVCGAMAWARLLACRGRVLNHLRPAYQFVGQHRLAAAGLVTAWMYAAAADMLGLGGAKEPAAEFWMGVAHHHGSVLAMDGPSIPALNHLVFFAPWQPGIVAPLVFLSAYVTIGFSTYALARRYAWPSMAATVALLVTAMPRILVQAMGGGSELIVAAAALVAILALYRLVEAPMGVDVAMLFSAAAFTVDGGKLCYLVVAVLVPLSGILFVRRHGMDCLQSNNRRSEGQLLVCLAAAVVFLQLAVVVTNILWGRPWIGVPAHYMVGFNPDPLWGTLGNMARYLMLSFDFPGWIDGICQYTLDFTPSAVLGAAYARFVVPVTGTAGTAAAFLETAANGAAQRWFGPVGCLLVMPSIVFSLWRGPRRLKATALAMLVYWSLVALIVAWHPANVRLMTVFFVCSGFFMAFFLPPWRLGRNGRLLLQVLGIAQIVHVMLA